MIILAWLGTYHLSYLLFVISMGFFISQCIHVQWFIQRYERTVYIYYS
jgi:hypothetical protein